VSIGASRRWQRTAEKPLAIADLPCPRSQPPRPALCLSLQHEDFRGKHPTPSFGRTCTDCCLEERSIAGSKPDTTAMQRYERPNGLHESKWPGALQKAVGRSERAYPCKSQNKPRAKILQRIASEHGGNGKKFKASEQVALHRYWIFDQGALPRRTSNSQTACAFVMLLAPLRSWTAHVVIFRPVFPEWPIPGRPEKGQQSADGATQ
jgi:hypothetical protein